MDRLIAGLGRAGHRLIASIVGTMTLLPQSEAAVITEAGHVPNFSHPAKLAALVRAFIKSEESIGIPLTRQESRTLPARRIA